MNYEGHLQAKTNSLGGVLEVAHILPSKFLAFYETTTDETIGSRL